MNVVTPTIGPPHRTRKGDFFPCGINETLGCVEGGNHLETVQDKRKQKSASGYRHGRHESLTVRSSILASIAVLICAAVLPDNWRAKRRMSSATNCRASSLVSGVLTSVFTSGASIFWPVCV